MGYTRHWRGLFLSLSLFKMWNKPEGGRERELIASYCVYYSVQPMSTERRRLLRETESCIRKKRGDGYIEWKAEAEKKGYILIIFPSTAADKLERNIKEVFQYIKRVSVGFTVVGYYTFESLWLFWILQNTRRYSLHGNWEDMYPIYIDEFPFSFMVVLKP
jgi:hypothetical protein